MSASPVSVQLGSMRWGHAVDRLLVALPLAVAVGIVAIALWWRPHPGEPARLLTGTEACATVNFSNPQNGRLGMSVSFRRDDCRDPEPATAFEFSIAKTFRSGATWR